MSGTVLGFDAILGNAIVALDDTKQREMTLGDWGTCLTYDAANAAIDYDGSSPGMYGTATIVQADNGVYLIRVTSGDDETYYGTLTAPFNVPDTYAVLMRVMETAFNW